MTQPRQYFERHSIRNYLETQIPTYGWTDITFREGFASQEDIAPPMLAITNLPSRMLELQMGRSTTTNKSFNRLYQIDCYMETEARMMTIADDVGDAIDQMYINITDPSGTNLGTLFCPNVEDIVIRYLTPVPSEPRVRRWRATVQFPIEAHYLND